MPKTSQHDAHSHQHDSHQHDSHQHDSHQYGGDPSSPDMLDLLELDAQVLSDYWTDALDWVRQRATGDGWQRLLDLGTGTGTGALGLAERFGGAEVTAIDISAESLQRLRDKAAAAGLADRLRAVEADLDGDWPEIGQLDLSWASMSLHHLADPGRALHRIRSATRPDGLIAVAEFSEPLRFLPDDLGIGEPGFETRTTATFSRAHTELMPTLGSEWEPRLVEAGWQVVDHREFSIDLDPPRHPAAARYVQTWFSRLSEGFADRLTEDDQQTLAVLLDQQDPRSVAQRGDLHIRGIRTVTLARNASS